MIIEIKKILERHIQEDIGKGYYCAEFPKDFFFFDGAFVPFQKANQPGQSAQLNPQDPWSMKLLKQDDINLKVSLWHLFTLKKIKREPAYKISSPQNYKDNNALRQRKAASALVGQKNTMRQIIV